jgi:hypothetical protein
MAGGERDDCSASAPRTYPPTATMTVAFTGFVDSTVPLRLLLPNATIANGEVSCDLTSFAGGAGLFTTLHATGAVLGDTTITAGTGLRATTGGVTASAGNIVAALGNITASAGNVTAPLGGVSGATLTATTSLNVTGANVVGLTDTFQIPTASLSANATVWGISPYSGTIVSAQLIVNGSLSDDVVLTGNIGATPITNGVITAVGAGSAAGSIFSCSPTAANIVVAGTSAVNFVINVGSNISSRLGNIIVTVRRSA